MTVQPYEPAAPIPQTDSWVPVLGAVGDLASELAATSFVPKSMRSQPASVAAAILTGRELNLGPMASLRGIQVIEGVPALTAQMLAAKILAARHRIEWLESTDTRCTVRIQRGDGLSSAEATWTWKDAERAGLAGRAVWRQYPRHMLRHRALSEAAGMCCPDVALGLDVQEAPTEATERGPVTLTTVQVETPTAALPAPSLAVSGPPAAARVAETREETSGSGEGSGPPAHLQQAPPAAADEAYRPDSKQPVDVEGPPGPELVTRAQLRKINAQLSELARLDDAPALSRDQRRALISELAGVELVSAKDMTKGQGHTVIEALDRLVREAMDAVDVVDAEVVDDTEGAP